MAKYLVHFLIIQEIYLYSNQLKQLKTTYTFAPVTVPKAAQRSHRHPKRAIKRGGQVDLPNCGACKYCKFCPACKLADYCVPGGKIATAGLYLESGAKTLGYAFSKLFETVGLKDMPIMDEDTHEDIQDELRDYRIEEL